MSHIIDPIPVTAQLKPLMKPGVRIEDAVDALVQSGKIPYGVKAYVDTAKQQIQFPYGEADNPSVDLYRTFYKTEDGEWYLSPAHYKDRPLDPYPNL